MFSKCICFGVLKKVEYYSKILHPSEVDFLLNCFHYPNLFT